MRISRQVMFMEMAATAAKRSTCFRASVGAIIVHNNSVLAIGYNGPPAGEAHCTGITCPGAAFGCTRSLHAERNALIRLPGGHPHNLDLYITHSPCVECSALMRVFSVKRLFFREVYRVNDHLQELMVRGIELYQVQPSGFTISWLTKELVNVE